MTKLPVPEQVPPANKEMGNPLQALVRREKVGDLTLKAVAFDHQARCHFVERWRRISSW